LLTGTVAACIALVSASSPSKKMGFSLGLLQTGVFLGTFLGPLLGGISADILGFRNSFKITAALLFFAGWLVFFLVEEKFSPSDTKKNSIVFNKIKALIFKDKLIPIMFFVLFIFRFSIKLITPIISLFVEMIAPNSNHVSILTGIMFALTGLMSAFSAMNVSKLIEKKPSKNILLLIISLIGSGVFFLAQGLLLILCNLLFLDYVWGFFMEQLLL